MFCLQVTAHLTSMNQSSLLYSADTATNICALNEMTGMKSCTLEYKALYSK